MDYDENDFQSQNLQLAGEGSSTFPPVLRQYALPKFDFDENIQGHVRFDSLVETEVFLGIESNEDNQWIEDFSRGSSGVEFSTSAAENCCILRRKNVWSEATSSESVEMLLKSVGQEDTKPIQARTEESNDCDKVKQMEPTIKHDNESFSEIDNIMNLEPTSVPAESHEEFLEVIEPTIRHCESHFSEMVSVMDLERTSLTDEMDEDFSALKEDTRGEMTTSIDAPENLDGSLSHIDSTMSCKDSGLPTVEGCQINDQSTDLIVRNKVDSLVKISLQENEWENCCVSVNPTDDIASSTQNLSAHGFELNNVRLNRQMMMESSYGSQKGSAKEEDDNGSEKKIQSDDQDTVISASLDVKEKVDSGITNDEDDLNVISKVSYELNVGKEHEEIVHSEISAESGRIDDKVMWKSGEQGDQSETSVVPVLSKGEIAFNSHTVEAQVGHIGTGMCANQESKTDSVVSGMCTNTIVEDRDGCPLNTDVLVINDKVMWKSGERVDQSETSVVPVLSKGEIAFNSNTVEAQVSHIGTGMCASQESKTDSVVNVISTYSVVEDRDDRPLNTDVLVINESSSLSTKQNEEVSKGEECNSSLVGESFSLPPICSAGLSDETYAKASLSGEHDASGVVIELNAEVVKAVVLGESAQILEDTVHHGKDNVCGLDVSAGEKETTRSSYESISSDCQVDKAVHSSAFGEHRADTNLVVHSVQCNETDSKDQGPIIYLDSMAVGGSPYDAQLGIGDGMVVDKQINHNKDQEFNSEVEHSHMDAKEENMMEESAKESIITLLGSSQFEATSFPISFSADETSIIIGEKTLSDKINQKEKCNIEVESEPKAAASDDTGKNSTEEMDVVPISCELTARISDSVDVMPVTRQVSTNDQMAIQSMVLPLQKIKESSGKNLEDQELNQNVSASEEMNDGKAVNSDCGKDKEFSSAAFGQSIVQESAGCTVSGKPASPIGAEILSGFEYENKFSKGPSVPILLVSESSDGNVMNKWSTSQSPKNPSASENARSHPLEPTPLEDLSNTESHMDQQIFPSISAARIPPMVDGSLSTPALGLIDTQDATDEIPQASDREVGHCNRKGSTERRTRRSSAKGTKKESTKKVNLPKTVKSLKPSGGDKSSNLPSSPGVFHPVHSNEPEHHRHVESSNVKPFLFVTASTSNLPDLNSSASPSAMFQQPFTDLQQVELRAQIFVYGALIQGIAPDEAYMLAAFGGPDSGRSLWENAWRMCTERLHGQKSYPTSSETSLQSHSGVKGVDQTIKQSTLQSKVFSSPVGGLSNKSAAAVVNSMIPPTSPLWNISNPSEALQSVVPRGSIMEYQQSLSPLYPYQTPPMRNFIGATTPWLSQAPFRSPWVTTPQTSAPEVARFSALPITEPVHLTPLKEPYIPQSSGLKVPGPNVLSSISTTMFPVLSPLLDTKRTSLIQHSSTDPKPRKRKKISIIEDPNQTGVHSSPQVERISFPTMVHSQSTSVSISTSSELSSKDASEKSIFPVFSLPSSAGLKKGHDIVWNTLSSEDTLGKIKEAKQQAEDASAFASKAVQHGQELWSQLGRQNNSGLESDVRAKISSSAIAIAAAVAVANAAAAAAKVASNAALQAKLMADEALASMGYENSGHSHDFAACSVEDGVGKGDSASKLRNEGGTSSSSIILAAKEAARKRVEATTAASKQAENMDAIVKAAELAAEAVSQAGKIVAMGEPLPLSELIKVGPDGCLKVPQLAKSQQSNELVIRSDEKQLKVDRFHDYTNLSAKPSKEGLCVTSERSPLQGVISKSSIENQQKLVDCGADPGILSENDLLGKGHKVSDLSKTIGVVPESDFEARSSQSTFEKVTNVKDNTIKEGSLVEILRDGKAVWFTASVLTLNDRTAYVCYNELRQEEGLEPLKEWVALESQEDQVPKIRISRPISAKQYEGTRKRRRAVLTTHAWSVGDRVDAWVQDSWWEGVVTENQKDGTTIAVHFPAKEETIAVKIWHLRPSLIWKDGKWVEWSIDHGSENSLECDMPREKRQKLGSPTVKAKEHNIPKISSAVGPGSEDSRLIVLSANERAFNVGKTTENENKSYPLRTARTGLQEGSRVIFGVPKPGKKRKFMEVSKHYVGNHNKGTGSSDSGDFAKYMMRQGSGLRRSKNPTKPEIVGKRASEMKPKGNNNKSGKPPGVLGRTMPQRANYSTNAGSSSTHGADSETNAENNLGKHNATNIGSSDGPSEEGSMIFSSVDPLGEAPKQEQRAHEGKFAPGGGRNLAKIEEDKGFHSNSIKPTSDTEPRRSVRRIQPTSRLLEGLQSSLTVSKNPSLAHEKGRKRPPARPASKANNI